MTPALPYTRPKTKEGYLRKSEYVYDEYYDTYICPQGQMLRYSTTTKEGYRQYFSNPMECQSCHLLSSCTQSKDHKKLIQRHVWEHYLEEADHLRHTKRIKASTLDERKPLSACLLMPKKSMVCDGQP